MNILSAKWANAENSAAVLQTQELGAVAVSADRTVEWAQFQAWIAGGGVPSAYQAPAAPTQQELEDQCKAGLNGTGGIDVLKALRAKVVSDEAYRLNKAPGDLTAAERQAIRNRIAAIYKAL